MFADGPREKQCLNFFFRGLAFTDDFQVVAFESMHVTRLDQHAARYLLILESLRRSSRRPQHTQILFGTQYFESRRIVLSSNDYFSKYLYQRTCGCFVNFAIESDDAAEG